ncbi:MAG: AAA family ATPase [Planctomycetota bacterium]|jgi:hypothetical protein
MTDERNTTTRGAPARSNGSRNGRRGGIERMINDPTTPLELRKQFLMQLCTTEGEAADTALARVLKQMSNGSLEEQDTARLEELDALIAEMKAGPLRSAVYLAEAQAEGMPRRAKVLMPDGSTAFCVLQDDALAASLRRGDTVWLEAQGRAVLFREPDSQPLGEEARMVRALDGERVEVELRDQGRAVFLASARVGDRLVDGEAAPGTMLLVCPQRRMAFDALPEPEGLGHFRYLVREPPPDVVVERDIGCPPLFLSEWERHLRRALTDPGAMRRHRLPLMQTRLLVGATGSGKTFGIQGWWNRMLAVTAEILGVDVTALPPCVLRLRSSEILSKWLGESDHNVDRFFDEVEELAKRTWRGPDGREHVLPLLVIGEEIDGMARARGGDAIYDRIQSTLLQRFDASCSGLADQLVYFAFTSNVEGLIDAAFLRRAGGKVERFGRLDRGAFRAVLDRHLDGRPLAAALGRDEPGRRQALCDVLDAWLYSPHGEDEGQVELGLAGTTTPHVARRRDLLTAALVASAVNVASEEACEAEFAGEEGAGLDAVRLACALDAQVRTIVGRLEPENVTQYLTLPEGARVVNVRRLPPRAPLPLDLERVS